MAEERFYLENIPLELELFDGILCERRNLSTAWATIDLQVIHDFHG